MLVYTGICMYMWHMGNHVKLFQHIWFNDASPKLHVTLVQYGFNDKPTAVYMVHAYRFSLSLGPILT